MSYIAIINVQWIESVWIFLKVLGAKLIACLLQIKCSELFLGILFITAHRLKLVATDGCANSTPCTEKPVPDNE